MMYKLIYISGGGSVLFRSRTPSISSITLSSCTTTPSISSITPFKSIATSSTKHHAPLLCKASGSSSYSITDFDLYDLLGVDSSSDHSAIKQAYRSLQKKCHPDIAGIAGHDMAIVLNEAYAVLSDPLSRFDYDKLFKSIDGNQDFVNELDAAISELTSNPHFPQGLRHLSSATLSKARSFILEHLVRALPMRDSHIKAVLKATIELDLDELQRTEINYLDVYIDKLKLQNEEGMMDFVDIPCPDDIPHVKDKDDPKINLTTCAIQGIKKRQLAVSCVSTVETSVNSLAKTITQINSNDGLLQEQQNYSTANMWNHWRTRTLSYLLDKRTIRLVSGASMVFSAPKVQWAQVFERLDMSKEPNVSICETIELLLVGCVSSRWNHIIQHFMSNSHEQPLSISTLYEGVHRLILDRFQNNDHLQQIKHSEKEQEIIEYLEVNLSNQIHHLWELSPALIAASLPPWSRVFEIYASELLSQYKGKTTKIRCCSCIDDNKEHIECEVVERIWCLYMFHVSKIQSCYNVT